MDEQVTVTCGTIRFSAKRALVRIDPQPAMGGVIRHVWVYLDQVEPAGEPGKVWATSDRLLVTLSTTGTVSLATDDFQPADATPRDAFVDQGRRRMARFGDRLNMAVADLPPQQPIITTPTPPTDITPPEPPAIPMPRVDRGVEILPPQGAVYFSFDRVVTRTLESGERAVILIGNVRLMYDDRESGRQSTLSAERAVVFLAPEQADAQPAAQGQAQASQIRGVYLEDNAIVSEGRYSVRAPRMFYDPVGNRAILLEAVVYTRDVRTQLPLYLRAQTMRQTSQSTWEASKAIVTTSEFAEPHFAVAASRLVMQRKVVDGQERFAYSATNARLAWDSVPIFYWPYATGETRKSVLQDIRFRFSSQDGTSVMTRWDLFGLFGQRPPDGVRSSVHLDYLGNHGVGIGIDGDYERDTLMGRGEGYLLPMDDGTDTIADRNDIDQSNETRGFVQWQHRQALLNDWIVQIEGAYVSDETFLEEFFPGNAHSSKPYETSIYALRQRDDWAFDSYFRFDVNDFLAQTAVLQAPGYTVDRLPELGYYRVGSSVFDNFASWFTESRLSVVQARFGNDTPQDRGFGPNNALRSFGIANTTSFDGAAEARGFPDDLVGRLDTRHELSAPLKAGPVSIVPYVTGRVTAYDSDFDRFNNGRGDQVRFWGAAGARVSTQVARTYDQIELSLLDINGIRHVIEPSADLFFAQTSVDARDLPAFDQDVEPLADGAGLELGLTNTWQTRRGGPGRWRNIDWIVLDTRLVLREDAEDQDSTILPRYFDYRPEYSVGGDHFYTELLWMVTDSLGMTGELTHSLERDEVVQWRIGATMRHNPDLTSFATFTELDALDQRLVTYGVNYRLTVKYEIGFSHRIDLGQSAARDINAYIERKLPRWRFRTVVSFNEIEDEFIVGILLVPDGIDQNTITQIFDSRNQ